MNGSTWTSIGATCNGSTGAIVLYIDGVAVDTDTATASYVANAGNQSENLYFSSIPAWASAANHYDGAVDNIRLYNTVLTANQMMALHLYPAEQGGGKISANILSAGMLQSSNYNGSSAGLAFDLDNAQLKVYETDGLYVESGGGIKLTGGDSTPGSLFFYYDTAKYVRVAASSHTYDSFCIMPSENNEVDFDIGSGFASIGESASIFKSFSVTATDIYMLGDTQIRGDLDVYQASADPVIKITRDSNIWQLSVNSSDSLLLGESDATWLTITTAGLATFGAGITTGSDIDIDPASGDAVLKLSRGTYIYSMLVDSSDQFLIKDGSTALFTLANTGNITLAGTDLIISPSGGVPKLSLIRQISGSPEQWNIYLGPNHDFFIENDTASRFYIDTDGNAKIYGQTFSIATSKTPGGSDAGSPGQICWDTTNLYIYTDNTNKWKKITLTDF
jgi:hypothetical protein